MLASLLVATCILLLNYTINTLMTYFPISFEGWLHGSTGQATHDSIKSTQGKESGITILACTCMMSEVTK